jgi:hypothetical protein
MPIPKKIDDEKQYRIELSRPVELHPNIWARPGDDVTISGALLKTIQDSVTSAVAED